MTMDQKVAGKKIPFIIAAAAVVAAGSVAAYLYFFGFPGKKANVLESAKFVPDEAFMTTFITTDSQSWAKLKRFGTPEAQKIVADSLQQMPAQMLGLDLNYEKDLKPWMGGITIAYLPPSNSAATTQSNTLMVVGIENQLKALEVSKRLQDQSKATVKETAYKGVNISNITQQDGQSYSTAVLDKHLLLASEPALVQQAIDTYKGEPSFASQNEAAKLLAQGVEVENPLAQIYLTDYAGAMQQLLSNSQQPPTTLEQLQQVQSMVVGVGVDDQGVRLKAKAQLDPQAATQEYTPASNQLINEFPAQTMLLATGKGISQGWQELVRRSSETPQLKASVDQIRQSIQQTVNLNADKEVFGWMDGEVALGVIPSNQGILSTFGFGAALVIDTSDRATATATLDKLGQQVKQSIPFLTSAERQANGIAVQEWTMPQGSLLGYGWLDNDTVFVGLGPLVDVIAGQPEQPLTQSKTFKDITGTLPTPNQGYFYLDMDQTLSIFNTILAQTGRPIPPEASTVLGSMQGVGVTATWPNKATSQLEMLLSLKRS
jgi:hypothetical protein